MCRSIPFALMLQVLAGVVGSLSLGTSACATNDAAGSPSPAGNDGSAEVPTDPPPAQPSIEAGASFGEQTRTPSPLCDVGVEAENLEEHACFHLTSGPFGAITAGAPDRAPALAKTHTAYTVTIVDRERRWVSFRAKKDATFALLLSAEATVDLFNLSGEVRPPTCEGGTTGICKGLPRGVHLAMKEGETVLVGLTPASGDSIVIVLEQVSP